MLFPQVYLVSQDKNRNKIFTSETHNASDLSRHIPNREFNNVESRNPKKELMKN